jgi:flagellar basal-body rod protein FlgB
MLESLNITRMAEALAEHSSKRLGLIAKNVAQASTPGYKALDLPDFNQVYQDNPAGSMRATRPGHITSAGTLIAANPEEISSEASLDGNSVSVEDQMVKSVMVRQDHEMALAVYSSARDILRTSLGRK